MKPSDRIDDAIDQVAARMTRVDDDAELAARISASLPERSGWALNWLVPRLAITAALGFAAALVVLRSVDDRSTNDLRTAVPSSPIVEQPATFAVPAHRTSVAPTAIVRRTIVEPPSNDRRTIDNPDFERSLEAIAPAVSLALASLAPGELREQGTLVVEPLEIADLPLTADSFSPR